MKVGYDSATRTVLLGEQTAPASAAVASGLYWHRETDEDGVTYASEDPGIDYTEAPGYALTKLPEGWGLESVRAGMGGRGNLSYRNGSGGRISFSCAYPDGGSYGWSPGSGEIPCRTVTVNGHDAALYTYSSEYGDRLPAGVGGRSGGAVLVHRVGRGPGYAGGGRILRGAHIKDCARL